MSDLEESNGARDIRDVPNVKSEKNMTSGEIAEEAVRELKASLADDVSNSRISAEDADKVIADQVKFQKEMMEKPSGDQSELSRATNAAKEATKRIT